MPNATIETRTGRITDPAAAIAAVRDGLRAARHRPDRDRTLRLVEHAPGHCEVPPGRGERDTLVELPRV
ncbi:MAG: hypothetical protein ABSC95_30790 [Acetobacteraceae bacterium]|jgi:hypothetical protein